MQTEIQGDAVEKIDNVQWGLHAQRYANPKVGDVWVSTDIKKFFVCFATNVWTQVNAVNLTGASDGDFFSYDGTTGFLIPKTVNALQYGLEADLPESPSIGEVYIATDSEVVYYCFEEGAWEATYLPKYRLTDWELDTNGDITIIANEKIFETDGNNDMVPSIDGTVSDFFDIVGGEITPKDLT